MPRDPLLSALADELAHVSAGLNGACKLLAEIQRAGVSVDAPAGRPKHTDPVITGAATSLRHRGLTVEEAGALLGITAEHVRRLLRRGDLIGVPFGGQVGWRLSRQYVSEVAEHWQNTQAAKDAVRRSRLREASVAPRGIPPKPRQSPGVRR